MVWLCPVVVGRVRGSCSREWLQHFTADTQKWNLLLRRKLNIAPKQREGDPVCKVQFLEREQSGELNMPPMGHLDLTSQLLWPHLMTTEVYPRIADHRHARSGCWHFVTDFHRLCSLLCVYMINCAQFKIISVVMEITLLEICILHHNISPHFGHIIIN